MAEALALAWLGRSLLQRFAGRWSSKAAARRLLGLRVSYLYVTSERLRSGLDGFVLGSCAAVRQLDLWARTATRDDGVDTICGIGMQLLPVQEGP
jgi:hypothetical protein